MGSLRRDVVAGGKFCCSPQTLGVIPRLRGNPSNPTNQLLPWLAEPLGAVAFAEHEMPFAAAMTEERDLSRSENAR